MQVVRRGYSETDCKVTVLVSVKDMFDAKCERIKSRIRGILAHSDTELDIQIIQGDEVWAKGDTRPADISISAFTTSVG